MFFQIILNAEHILFTSLKNESGGSPGANAQEVCACKSGKLFLAPAGSNCKESNICGWSHPGFYFCWKVGMRVQLNNSIEL